MRKLFLFLIIFCVPFFNYADIKEERFLQSEEAVQQASYGHIDAKGLKALIDSRTSFILLDARGTQWHDNIKIPDALLASYELPAEEINAIIPNIDSLIVVYCYSFNCPLSRKLAQNLVEFGYSNVIEYPGGLSEWRDIANYPVEPIIDDTP
jgi:rhodanese-related sulfurtransferase